MTGGESGNAPAQRAFYGGSPEVLQVCTLGRPPHAFKFLVMSGVREDFKYPESLSLRSRGKPLHSLQEHTIVGLRFLSFVPLAI